MSRVRISDRWRRDGAVMAAFLWLICAAGPALAQRELRISTSPETPMPFVTTVVAPAARFSAVSEVAGALAVGHRPKQPAHVSIFRLDAQGQIVPGEPVTILLPKPAALGARPNHVIGMAWHPRFPLLYVWQDVEPQPAEGPPIDPATSAEFDHLLVYSLEEAQLNLVLATARGADFYCGNAGGGFALNATATRLYVPNMQQPDKMKKMVTAIGWLWLDPDGLPVFAKPDEKPNEVSLPTAKPSSLDPPAAATARAAKLALWEQAKVAGQPLVLRKTQEVTVQFHYSYPSPACYAPIDDDAVLLTASAGIMSWAISDRLGRFSYFYLLPQVPHRYRLALHPDLPVVYVTTLIYDGRIIRMEHADGAITLTPQTVLLDNIVTYSPVQVLTKRNQLAVGANGWVCLVDLDERGRFKPQGFRMTVNNPTVETIAWSSKFERLYVPVEKTP